jgi:hypothetical protein
MPVTTIRSNQLDWDVFNGLIDNLRQDDIPVLVQQVDKLDETITRIAAKLFLADRTAELGGFHADLVSKVERIAKNKPYAHKLVVYGIHIDTDAKFDRLLHDQIANITSILGVLIKQYPPSTEVPDLDDVIKYIERRGGLGEFRAEWKSITSKEGRLLVEASREQLTTLNEVEAMKLELAQFKARELQISVDEYKALEAEEKALRAKQEFNEQFLEVGRTIVKNGTKVKERDAEDNKLYVYLDGVLYEPDHLDKEKIIGAFFHQRRRRAAS